ncbi:hypothetical protein MSSIT_1221 [Methanosarcina siciliae T4/M]|uniref:Uncharacterized protein n=2 Tax=Methanosarcina siciliae TaxID=38027 RepID=A0A0E3P5L5_9EURY|nr:hypothetical protein MSSIT_1221 [Methanosarcina siciliae T4/M]
MMSGETLEIQLKKRQLTATGYGSNQPEKSTKVKKILRVYAVESAMTEYFKKSQKPPTDAEQITKYITDESF